MLNRREFLRLSAATAAGLACRGGAPGDLLPQAHPELLAILGAAAVRRLGTQYRRMVALGNSGRGMLAGHSCASLAQLVREDFDAGRTVIIDGWVISVTEARQCALYSLLPA
jgi:hypothetical protein